LSSLPAYNDPCGERFWRRGLGLEYKHTLAVVLQQCGAETAAWFSFLDGEGRHELDRIRSEAEAAGVFGVPSFLFGDGELYWGREHLPQVRERLMSEPPVNRGGSH